VAALQVVLQDADVAFPAELGDLARRRSADEAPLVRHGHRGVLRVPAVAVVAGYVFWACQLFFHSSGMSLKDGFICSEEWQSMQAFSSIRSPIQVLDRNSRAKSPGILPPRTRGAYDHHQDRTRYRIKTSPRT